MRAALLALVAGPFAAPPPASAYPTLTLDAPAHVDAWSASRVTLVVHNATALPILLLSASGSSSHGGSLGRWDAGTWAYDVPAVRSGALWQILFEPSPQQETPMMSPPHDTLRKITPIAPGATVELVAPFVAGYEFDGAIAATITYIALDPKALCAAALPVDGGAARLIPCTPITSLAGATGAIYATDDALAQNPSATTVYGAIHVDHPAFDLPAAQATAKLTATDYAYLRATNQWALFDGAHTTRVDANGAQDALPGNWLAPLLELDHGGELSIRWHATHADAAQLPALAQAAHLELEPARRKGGTVPDAFEIDVTRDNFAALIGLVRSLGYRMGEQSIVK